MRRRITALGCLVIFLSTFSNLPAQITWVGSVSDDIFDEANWDLSGSAVTMIDPNVSIMDDVLIGAGPFTNSPVIPQLDGQQRFQLDDGQTLTVAGNLGIAGNDGVGGAPGTTNGPTVNVIDGGHFAPFFVVNDVKVNIDGTSSATFGGGGNPINLSTLDLTSGSLLTFLAETPDQYRAEHLSKTMVDGVAGIEGVNLSIASDGANGSVITVVPEPSGVLLGLLGGLALFCRRPRR